MAVGGTQPALRKYLGALKDTTTVSLAKVNSDYKVKTFSIFMTPLNNIEISHVHTFTVLTADLSFPPTTGVGHCNCQGHKPC
jgi:hypothetical protein